MTPVGRSTTAMGRVGGLLTRPPIQALFVASAALAGYLAAHATPREPIVITLSHETLEAPSRRAPRGTALAASPAGQTTTAVGQPTTAQVAARRPRRTRARLVSTGLDAGDRGRRCRSIDPRTVVSGNRLTR